MQPVPETSLTQSGAAPPVPTPQAAFTGKRQEAEEVLVDLRNRAAAHPFWGNSVFLACEEGVLSLDDLRLFFSQYYLYSKNFTRYLAGLMARCDDDFFRARISENLWEEGGGTEPEKRHAQLFRNFLCEGLGIENLDRIEHFDFTRHFVSEYTTFCLQSEPAATSAFLSLGTEGIVKRMYEIFVGALIRAGVKDEQLDFFHIHIDGDDAHAFTLEEMMLSYSREPGWRETCLAAMEHALTLRHRFFENLFEAIQTRRVRSLMQKIQARTPLKSPVLHAQLSHGTHLYANTNDRLGIDFQVTRLPFTSEVLDPRVVRIPPGKNNELHKHAHETVFFVVEGRGVIQVDDEKVEVREGELVFVPRWAFHQTRNTGDDDLCLLAFTDYGLTGRAYIGNYLKTARMGPNQG